MQEEEMISLSGSGNWKFVVEVRLTLFKCVDFFPSGSVIMNLGEPSGTAIQKD